jgi:uncharacterized protein (DUF488 family)
MLKLFNEPKNLLNGKNVVLLCNEGETLFCHRHIVARWLTDELKLWLKVRVVQEF